MTDVEYFRKAALRALADASLTRETFRFNVEHLGLAKGHSRADSIVFEYANEVVPTLDGRDDGQSGTEVVDGFGRYRETGHPGDGRNHADVASA